MEFDWDDGNLGHIALHAVTAEEAEQVFLNDPIDVDVQEDDDDGYRYKQIGETNSGRILFCLSTVRGEAVRIFTAYDAPKAVKNFYLQVKARRSWKT